MPPVPPARRQLASDNYAGICPEALEAMLEANVGHAPPPAPRRPCDGPSV